MKNRKRLAIFTIAALLFVGFGLSQLSPRAMSASTVVQTGESADKKSSPVERSIAASSLRGSLSLFSWGPGFYGFCYNGTEGNPQNDPPWVACPDDWTETITTYNLHVGLERLVRIPRQNGTFSHSKPRLSPDGTKIVFAEMGEDGYNLEIYVMNSDGTNPVNLTNHPSATPEDPQAVFRCRYAPSSNDQISNAFRCMDTEPAWSPDGQHIVFVSGRTGSRQLFVMKTDGSELTPLETRGAAYAGGGASEPVWSPDGTKLAYSLNRGEIALLTLNREEDADGKVTFTVEEDEPLISGPGGFVLIDNPAWSPDGSKLAFTHQDIDIPNNRLVWEIYTIRADGTGETRVTDTVDELEHHPVWSPDGSKLAYSAWKPEGTNFYRNGRLFVHDLNDSSRVRIETRGPNTDVFSWVDPCNASSAPGAAAKSARAKSAASKRGASAAVTTAYKCIKEIVVNVTTDAPDTNTTDEFCDTDADVIGNQCSLRAAIQEANARPGQDLINFEIPGAGVRTISPATALPNITEQVSIDGTSQPGYTASPLIAIRGDGVSDSDGLVFAAGSDASGVTALSISHFARAGIRFDSDYNRVRGSYVGLSADGVSVDENLRQATGIHITGGSNIVGGGVASSRNLITGNRERQILITSAAAKDNAVTGNSINRTADNRGVDGVFIGVEITGGASGNRVGGGITGEGNNIASTEIGVLITGDAKSNTVSRTIFQDCFAGVAIVGASNNIVGGDNLIEAFNGNNFFKNQYGVFIADALPTGGGGSLKNLPPAPNVAQAPTLDNKVHGNLFGAAGDGKNKYGVYVDTPTANTIGGDFLFQRNVILYSEIAGIGLDKQAANIKVKLNYIGIANDGQTPGPNATGVIIHGSQNRLIENVISGNTAEGVYIAPRPGISSRPTKNQLHGNKIGTDAIGYAAVKNGKDGIYLDGEENEIGASSPSDARNLISANGLTGINVVGDRNKVVSNLIGTNDDSDTPLGNSDVGIFIAGSGNTISANTVSGNAAGISITKLPGLASHPASNIVQKNYVGTDYRGMVKVPNTTHGIIVTDGANKNLLGGAGSLGNVVAGNNGYGILIVRLSGSTDVPFENTVQGNFVGTNSSGAAGLGNNLDGIRVSNVALAVNTFTANTISGNGKYGILIEGSPTPPTPGNSQPSRASANAAAVGLNLKIFGNLIGVVKSMTGSPAFKLANVLGGIKLQNVSDVHIGLPGHALSDLVHNIIAGNGGPGVLIEGANATDNIITDSYIGTDELGTPGLGNDGHGVEIIDAPDNSIGHENPAVGERRSVVIVGNNGSGVKIKGARGTALFGTTIGVIEAVGGLYNVIDNEFFAIVVDDAPLTQIGKVESEISNSEVGNLIVSRNGAGIHLTGAATTGTQIINNTIGAAGGDPTSFSPNSHGVWIAGGAGQTVVGGPEEGSGNIIADNGGSGVRIDETAGEGNLVDPNSIFNNRAYGIDLGRRGVTPNDFGDADTGPNRLQNYPEITARAVNADGHLVVSYRLTSAPGNSNYGTAGIYVEFFKADPSGEGERFLGFTHYTEADYNNGAPIVKQVNLGSVAALGINPDDPITATASDASNNTSEFSPPYSSRVLVVTKTDDTDDGDCDGDCSLREALADANAGDRIEFASPLFDAAQTITLGGSELLVNKSVMVKGKGAHLLTVSGNNLSRVFNVTDGATPTLSGLTITKGNAGGAFIGGGILNAGTLTLVESHVTDNIADRGAGLYNTETLVVRASTVSDNKANLGSATPAGGGIQNAGGGSLEVINSTVSGNSATVSDGAGGIYIADGTATITGSTIANNSAPQGASNAGGIKNKDGVVTLRGSIVALNTAASPNLVGAFTSIGFNLVGANEGAAASFPASDPAGSANINNDIVGTSAAAVDPRLDALGDYGGTTPTHQLQADSPAIDKGLAFGETTDQRGLTRPSDDSATPNAAGGDGSDIGAYEAQFAPPSSASLAGRITFGGSPLSGVTVTLTRPDSTTSASVTGSDGLYTFTNLVGGNYTLTPTRSRFTFTPESRPVALGGTDVTGLDFEATSTLSNPQPANGTVIISEFRFSGVTVDDEYVELYNNTDAPVDLSGYILETATGQTLIVPPNTTLPARGHYLFAHGTGYTLTGYAPADQPYTNFDLSGDTGLALINAAGVIADAVGLGTPPSPYREGSTSPSVNEAGQYAFTRKVTGAATQDTGVNAADFQLVSTDGGNYGGVGSQLGAPGPEGLSSPVQRNAIVKPMLLDPTAAATAPPNRVRSSFGANPTNAAFGTLSIQRRFKNASNEPVRRLRFRIVDLTTLGSPVSSAPQADLRVLSSTGTVRNSQNQVVATVNGLTLEEPPAQGLGGGINSTLTVALPGGMLAGGSSIDVQFLLGVQQEGNFRFFVNVEALTGQLDTIDATKVRGTKTSRIGKEQ